MPRQSPWPGRANAGEWLATPYQASSAVRQPRHSTAVTSRARQAVPSRRQSPATVPQAITSRADRTPEPAAPCSQPSRKAQPAKAAPAIAGVPQRPRAGMRTAMLPADQIATATAAARAAASHQWVAAGKPPWFRTAAARAASSSQPIVSPPRRPASASISISASTDRVTRCSRTDIAIPRTVRTLRTCQGVRRGARGCGLTPECYLVVMHTKWKGHGPRSAGGRSRRPGIGDRISSVLLPMSLADSVFLTVESAQTPMHVGGLELFEPPADFSGPAELFQQLSSGADVAPLFRKRPHRSLGTAGQWAWEEDQQFDLRHHVRHNSLPQPGRVLELLALCSRLHGTLLDRERPLWELHFIEGLADGRFALYFKVHHALLDGVSAQRLL